MMTSQYAAAVRVWPLANALLDHDDQRIALIEGPEMDALGVTVKHSVHGDIYQVFLLGEHSPARLIAQTDNYDGAIAALFSAHRKLSHALNIDAQNDLGVVRP